MKKFLLGGTALVAMFAGSAMAADIPVRAPVYKAPPMEAVYSWTGCYLGVNAGGIFGTNRYNLSMGGDFLLPGNIFSNPANQALTTHSTSGDRAGFTGGAQVGCNWQSGQLVYGVEADINGSSRRTTTAALGPIGPFVGGGAALMASHTESLTKSLDWYSTFRGRLGFTPAPNLLLYATGGLAVAEVKSSASLAFGADQFFLGSFLFNGSQSQTRTGFAAGAGAEWAVAPKWSIKAEYLYLGLGNTNYAARCFSPIASCAAASNFVWNVNVRAQDHIGRVGVNYHF